MRCCDRLRCRVGRPGTGALPGSLQPVPWDVWAARAWYARKCEASSGGETGKGECVRKGKGGERAKGSAGRLRVVTALVRKLALATWVVGAGRGTFEVERLLGLPRKPSATPAAERERKGGVAIATR